MNPVMSNIPNTNDKPDAFMLLVIILLVLMLHALMLLIFLSKQPETKPAVNILQAQILSKEQAGRIRAQATKPAPSHQSIRPAQTPPTSPSTQYSTHDWSSRTDTWHDTLDDYQETHENSEYSADMTSNTDESDVQDAQNTDNADNTQRTKTTPSPELRQVSKDAAASIIEAWEKYDNIGGKTLFVSMRLDDAGNVIDVKIGKGDQELAESATAAIYDKAPFRELAKLTNELTIEFNSVSRN